MIAKYSKTRIHQFIKAFVESKKGKLSEQSDEIFTIKYPDQTSSIEYTYDSAVAKERKSLVITHGSPTFQQILRESLENGVLCQVLLSPKENYEKFLRKYLADSPFACDDCQKVTTGEKTVSICVKSQPCHHQINNGKIVSVNVTKSVPVRYFLFYFSATFQNRLRPKNEEIITILLNEKGNIINNEDFDEDNILRNEAIEI